MILRLLGIGLVFGAILIVAGCSNSNDPVNAGKDLPVPPKKEKEKDKS